MVMAEDSIGMPARKAATRATFIPCSPSGMAQPIITSSTSFLSRPGTRPSAPWMATAARSSGRVARKVPLGALPTAVRTALTITASLMLVSRGHPLPHGRGSETYGAARVSKRFLLIPQWLAAFQGEGNPLLRLLLTAERKKSLPLQIQQILFADRSAGRDIAAAQHPSHP